jgi:hypothetical protein
MWKKKSIFWELEYWKFLEVRSAIDVMHVMKNVCVNLLGFLGLYGKTKDTREARFFGHKYSREKPLLCQKKLLINGGEYTGVKMLQRCS